MVAAVINSVWTPFTISFSRAIEISNNSSELIYWIDYMANWIFIIDIFVNFLASYKDIENGIEIFHPKLIAINYLNNGFLLDFISSLQLRYIGEEWFGIKSRIFIDLADMCQLLKTFRIKKILNKI